MRGPYNPGIAAIDGDKPRCRARQNTSASLKLATGFGHDANIASPYAWLRAVGSARMIASGCSVISHGT